MSDPNNSKFQLITPVHVHSLPGADDITRVELSNGIVVLARPNFNSPSVVISGYILAGALQDPDEHLGLAGFVAAGLMRGNENRDFQSVYDVLETVGASLRVDSGTHTTGFGGRCLAGDLPTLLEILADSLRRPTFPTEQIERLRSQILTGLAIRATDTNEMASLTFDGIVYAGHPYARPEDGFMETVSAIRVEDIIAFHEHNYGPKGMVISIVGGVKPQAAIEGVGAVLSDWENSLQALPPALPDLEPLSEVTRRSVAIPGKSQADILIGAAGPVRHSDDYMAAALGNNVLGQFGLMGRLGGSVREDAGLAYYAHSSLGSGIGPGPWYASAGVDPVNIERAIELIFDELRRFVSEPVTEEELADSQANFIGRLPLSLESNGGVAGALLNLERFDLGLDYYRSYPDTVRAVSVDDILSVAGRYLNPEHLAIAIAGPEL
jgi:zinc protease